MARSFSFDPFTAKMVDVSRRLSRMERQTFAENDPKAELVDEGIHYGRSHAETIDRLQARQMAAQLEDLAGVEEAPKRSEARKKANGRAKVHAVRAAPSGDQAPAQQTKSQPIGALPETPDKHPRGLFSELIDDGRKYAEMLVGSVRDFRTATGHLIRLPVEAASLVARRLQPKKS